MYPLGLPYYVISVTTPLTSEGRTTCLVSMVGVFVLVKCSSVIFDFLLLPFSFSFQQPNFLGRGSLGSILASLKVFHLRNALYLCWIDCLVSVCKVYFSLPSYRIPQFQYRINRHDYRLPNTAIRVLGYMLNFCRMKQWNQEPYIDQVSQASSLV